MFHIHVDAHQLSKELENYLLRTLNFWESNFSGHPQEVPHYETPIHLTYKTSDVKDFRNIFENIVNYLDKNPEVEVPCQFQLTNLAPGTFREDEIHVTLDRDKSHPRLINNLRKMGFFSAYMDKPDSRVEILTVQGSLKQIQQLLPQILHYIKDAGGAVKCSVKEERIVRWWVSSLELRLPPVINSSFQGSP